MCSIVASFDKKKLLELYNLNSYRGKLSFSLTSFKHYINKEDIGVIYRDEGELPEYLVKNLVLQNNDYIVAHSQAPTTNTNNIHPAIYGDALLWHNGIIKQNTISEGTWDTRWLLQNIIDYGWSSLSRIDGTFACIMYNDSQLYVFRNEISPLFIDDHLNISSTRFEGSDSLPPNKVFRLDLETRTYDPSPIAYFTTLENPYYLPEN